MPSKSQLTGKERIGVSVSWKYEELLTTWPYKSLHFVTRIPRFSAAKKSLFVHGRLLHFYRILRRHQSARL